MQKMYRDNVLINWMIEYDDFTKVLYDLQTIDLIISLEHLLKHDNSFLPFELNEDMNLPLCNVDLDVQ